MCRSFLAPHLDDEHLITVTQVCFLHIFTQSGHQLYFCSSLIIIVFDSLIIGIWNSSGIQSWKGLENFIELFIYLFIMYIFHIFNVFIIHINSTDSDRRELCLSLWIRNRKEDLQCAQH